MTLRISLALVGLLALGCGTGDPAGLTRADPGPCGTASPDARVCEPNEFCLDGACAPWVEQTLVEDVECPPALGADEVFFVAGGDLRAVGKAGGAVRSLGPAGGLRTGPCGGLRVDDGWVFRVDNDWRDSLGRLFGYPLAGGDPVSLTADERLVYGATVVEGRIYLAVDELPSELLEVDPSTRAAPRTVLSTSLGRFAGLARKGSSLYLYEERRVESGRPDDLSSVFLVFLGGSRGPALDAARNGWLSTSSRGELIFGEDACDRGGTLRLRFLRPGAAEFSTPIDVGCDLVVMDDVHAFLRLPDDPDRRLVRRPLAGGEATRVRGSDALRTVFGVDDAWLYGTRDGAIVRIPK